MHWWCEGWADACSPFMTDVMLLAKAVKLGSLTERWACLRLRRIEPEGTVTVSGMDEGRRWCQRCKEMKRLTRSWPLQPPEEVADRPREIDALAAAGEKWAKQDNHPWKLFTICLHNMFLVVLRAHKVKEDEMCSSTPSTEKYPRTRTPSTSCSCHNSPQNGRRRQCWDDFEKLVMGHGTVAGDTGMDLRMRWLDKPPPVDRQPRAHG